jgi:hypothetical protein
VPQIEIGLISSSTNVVQQFDTAFFEVMSKDESERTGVLVAETAFNHGVAATTCGNHDLAYMGMGTNKLCNMSCLDNC